MFLAKGYFTTAKNKLCSETGDFAVADIETCHEAAEELRYRFKNTEDLADWPKGCYQANNVYFNQHPTGSSNDEARQICKPRGKETPKRRR